MKSGTFYRLGLVVFGSITGGLLLTNLNSTTVKWMQDVFIAPLSGSPTKFLVAPYRDGFFEGSLQLAKNLPATTHPSPEEIQAQDHPLPPGKPENLGRPSTKEQMIHNCMQQPSCRKNFQEAKSGKRPVRGRPAATQPSPEEQELKKLPPPIMGDPKGPRSGLGPISDGEILAWLNPFQPSLAEAQAYSWAVNPLRPNAQQGSLRMATYGGYQYANRYPIIGPRFPWNNHTASENKSFVYFPTSIPTAGWYFIEVLAGPAQTKLRHNYSGPIIAAWDHSTTSCYQCYYTTVEYLEAGWHYFYFWSVARDIYIYSVAMESYP